MIHVVYEYHFYIIIIIITKTLCFGCEDPLLQLKDLKFKTTLCFKSRTLKLKAERHCPSYFSFMVKNSYMLTRFHNFFIYFL